VNYGPTKAIVNLAENGVGRKPRPERPAP